MKYSDMRGSSGIVGFIVHKRDGDEAVAACVDDMDNCKCIQSVAYLSFGHYVSRPGLPGTQSSEPRLHVVT
jgi:hypothetical protein